MMDQCPTNSKPRSARGFGGAPDSGGFGGAPIGGPSSAPINSSAPAVDALVKWFKADKGYGFVELAGGQGDAFLHANALHAAGHDTVPAGAKLRVQVGAGAKGAQVTRVLEVDTSRRRRAAATAIQRRASAAPGYARSVDRRFGHRKGEMVRRRQRVSASSPARTAAKTCSSISRSSVPPAFRISPKVSRSP